MTDLVADVEAMELSGLRNLWRERYGPAPRMRSVELVRLSLAWRLQADAYGGLSAEARGQLSGRHASPVTPMTQGTRLVREWGGKEHVVTAADGAYQYNGRSWKSLSEIARAITGVRWNGPRFFGLRAVSAGHKGAD